jgi:tetratricopeptide (TPR) repeat protein
MPTSDASRFWLATEAMLAIALVVLPWSFGGTTWARGLLLASGCGALLLWGIGAARNRRRWGWHPLLWVPFAFLGVALVQLIPLPGSLLQALSPVAGDLRDFALAPLGLEQPRPISMDPPSTARAVARLAGLTGLLVAAFQLGRLPAVRRRLFAVLALSGLSIALCGIVHLIASETALFGLHQFRTNPIFVTPFFNTNHAAAFMSLAGTVALALALDAENRDGTVGWGFVALACGVGVFLTYSRGGIGTFVATWGLVGAAYLARKGGGLRGVLPWVAIGATITFAGLVSFDELLARAESLSSLEKLRATKVYLWPMFFKGALEFWRAGMGVGAFELGFSRFQSDELSLTFTHPENLPLEWMAEVGFPLSAAALVLVVVAMWRVWVAVRSTSLERYIALGLVGVALHELFDFAFEFEAVGASVAVVAGLLASVSDSHPRAPARRHCTWLALGLVALGVVGLMYGTPTHHAAEKAMAEALSEKPNSNEVREAALPLIDRHPADWVLFSNVASDFARRGAPLEALAWTNRVLFLRPDDSRVHVAAAYALLRLGKPLQALGELKVAWVLGDSSSLPLGLRIAERADAWDRVLLEKPGHLTAAYGVLTRGAKNEEALRLLQTATEFSPSEEVRSEAQVLQVRHEAELGDPKKAMTLFDALSSEERSTIDLQLVRVRLLLKLHRIDEGIAELERLQAQAPSRLDVGFELASRLNALGRPRAAIEVLERLEPFVTGPASRSSLFQQKATLWQSQERWGPAVDALQTASRLEPVRPDLHYRLAELFERMGSLHSALDEVRRGRLLDTPEGAKAKGPWMERLTVSPLPETR